MSFIFSGTPCTVWFVSDWLEILRTGFLMTLLICDKSIEMKSLPRKAPAKLLALSKLLWVLFVVKNQKHYLILGKQGIL